MSPYPFIPHARPPATERATLDLTAEQLCRTFGLAGIAQGSWGNWSRLDALWPGHPGFVIRRAAEGLVLDTQRWDIGSPGGPGGVEGAGAGPTTRIIGVSRPWWRRLAERPMQRCLIPVSACTAPLPPRHDRNGIWDDHRESDWNARQGWFGMADEPVFTIAGLWRDTGDARRFAMLSCLADAPFPILPVVIAAEDRTRWLNAPWDEVARLLIPCSQDRIRIGLPDAAPAPYAGPGVEH